MFSNSRLYNILRPVAELKLIEILKRFSSTEILKSMDSGIIMDKCMLSCEDNYFT